MITPPSDVIITPRLRLEPLRVEHAVEMVDVLADVALYSFTGGTPPTLAELTRRYRSQVAGSGRADELWLNWIVRLAHGEAIGFVQATVESDASALAWTIGTPWQAQGYATEASVAMAARLHEAGAPPPIAWIHPQHPASQRVAEAIGMVATTDFDDDGEQRWAG